MNYTQISYLIKTNQNDFFIKDQHFNTIDGNLDSVSILFGGIKKRMYRIRN